MSLMRRMRDISAATWNERLERSEDPVRLIDGYLLQQAETIRETDRLLQECATHTESQKRQYVAAEEGRQKREQQALLALKAGEEELARLALQEKLLYEEKSVQYQSLYEQGQKTILELETRLNELRADYQEVYSKREYYLARLESVRLQQRMNRHMNGTGNHCGESLFRRMEERVSDMEIEAKALQDLRRMGQEALVKAGSTLQHVLDRELQNLKDKLAREGSSER